MKSVCVTDEANLQAWQECCGGFFGWYSTCPRGVCANKWGGGRKKIRTVGGMQKSYYKQTLVFATCSLELTAFCGKPCNFNERQHRPLVRRCCPLARSFVLFFGFFFAQNIASSVINMFAPRKAKMSFNVVLTVPSPLPLGPLWLGSFAYNV